MDSSEKELLDQQTLKDIQPPSENQDENVNVSKKEEERGNLGNKKDENVDKITIQGHNDQSDLPSQGKVEETESECEFKLKKELDNIIKKLDDDSEREICKGEENSNMLEITEETMENKNEVESGISDKEEANKPIQGEATVNQNEVESGISDKEEANKPIQGRDKMNTDTGEIEEPTSPVIGFRKSLGRYPPISPVESPFHAKLTSPTKSSEFGVKRKLKVHVFHSEKKENFRDQEVSKEKEECEIDMKAKEVSSITDQSTSGENRKGLKVYSTEPVNLGKEILTSVVDVGCLTKNTEENNFLQDNEKTEIFVNKDEKNPVSEVCKLNPLDICNEEKTVCSSETKGNRYSITDEEIKRNVATTGSDKVYVFSESDVENKDSLASAEKGKDILDNFDDDRSQDSVNSSDTEDSMKLVLDDDDSVNNTPVKTKPSDPKSSSIMKYGNFTDKCTKGDKLLDKDTSDATDSDFSGYKRKPVERNASLPPNSKIFSSSQEKENENEVIDDASSADNNHCVENKEQVLTSSPCVDVSVSKGLGLCGRKVLCEDDESGNFSLQDTENKEDTVMNEAFASCVLDLKSSNKVPNEINEYKMSHTNKDTGMRSINDSHDEESNQERASHDTVIEKDKDGKQEERIHKATYPPYPSIGVERHIANQGYVSCQESLLTSQEKNDEKELVPNEGLFVSPKDDKESDLHAKSASTSSKVVPLFVLKGKENTDVMQEKLQDKEKFLTEKTEHLTSNENQGAVELLNSNNFLVSREGMLEKEELSVGQKIQEESKKQESENSFYTKYCDEDLKSEQSRGEKTLKEKYCSGDQEAKKDEEEAEINQKEESKIKGKFYTEHPVADENKEKAVKRMDSSGCFEKMQKKKSAIEEKDEVQDHALENEVETIKENDSSEDLETEKDEGKDSTGNLEVNQEKENAMDGKCYIKDRKSENTKEEKVEANYFDKDLGAEKEEEEEIGKGKSSYQLLEGKEKQECYSKDLEAEQKDDDKELKAEQEKEVEDFEPEQRKEDGDLEAKQKKDKDFEAEQKEKKENLEAKQDEGEDVEAEQKKEDKDLDTEQKKEEEATGRINLSSDHKVKKTKEIERSGTNSDEILNAVHLERRKEIKGTEISSTGIAHKYEKITVPDFQKGYESKSEEKIIQREGTTAENDGKVSKERIELDGETRKKQKFDRKPGKDKNGKEKQTQEREVSSKSFDVEQKQCDIKARKENEDQCESDDEEETGIDKKAKLKSCDIIKEKGKAPVVHTEENKLDKLDDNQIHKQESVISKQGRYEIRINPKGRKSDNHDKKETLGASKLSESGSMSRKINKDSEKNAKASLQNPHKRTEIECVCLSGEEDEPSSTSKKKSSVDMVCKKCRDIWNDDVLLIIFKGTESVTVNSKITYGAIVCINDWINRNLKKNKKEAMTSIFERADLGKNIAKLNIDYLDQWLDDLLQSKKNKCCDVFTAVYGSEKDTGVVDMIKQTSAVDVPKIPYGPKHAVPTFGKDCKLVSEGGKMYLVASSAIGSKVIKGGKAQLQQMNPARFFTNNPIAVSQALAINSGQSRCSIATSVSSSGPPKTIVTLTKPLPVDPLPHSVFTADAPSPLSSGIPGQPPKLVSLKSIPPKEAHAIVLPISSHPVFMTSTSDLHSETKATQGTLLHNMSKSLDESLVPKVGSTHKSSSTSAQAPQSKSSASNIKGSTSANLDTSVVSPEKNSEVKKKLSTSEDNQNQQSNTKHASQSGTELQQMLKHLSLDLRECHIYSSYCLKPITNKLKYECPTDEDKISPCYFNMVKEWSVLNGYARVTFDIMLYEPNNLERLSSKTSSGIVKNRYVTKRELLTLQSIFILNPEKPDINLFYQVFVQILLSRGKTLLIPDSRSLLVVTENIRKKYNREKSKSLSIKILNENWDPFRVYSAEEVWLAKADLEEVTNRDIISLFCTWKNLNKPFDGTLSEAVSLLSKSHSLKSFDGFGLCVRLYIKYCRYLFEDQFELAKAFLDEPFSGTDYIVSKKCLSQVINTRKRKITWDLEEEEHIQEAMEKYETLENVALEELTFPLLKNLCSALTDIQEKLEAYSLANEEIDNTLKLLLSKRDALTQVCQNSHLKWLTAMRIQIKAAHQDFVARHQEITSMRNIKKQKLTGPASKGDESVAPHIKKLIEDLLLKGVKPEKILYVINSVSKNAQRKISLELPTEKWIRNFAKRFLI